MHTIAESDETTVPSCWWLTHCSVLLPKFSSNSGIFKNSFRVAIIKDFFSPFLTLLEKNLLLQF